MVYTLTKGRRFLLDKPFKLYTDHKPLLGLLKKAARGEHIEKQRMARMLLDIVEEFNLKLFMYKVKEHSIRLWYLPSCS